MTKFIEFLGTQALSAGVQETVYINPDRVSQIRTGMDGKAVITVDTGSGSIEIYIHNLSTAAVAERLRS